MSTHNELKRGKTCLEDGKKKIIFCTRKILKLPKMQLDFFLIRIIFFE